MRVSATALSAALVGIVLMGCDAGETSAPDWFDAREPMPSEVVPGSVELEVGVLRREPA